MDFYFGLIWTALLTLANAYSIKEPPPQLQPLSIVKRAAATEPPTTGPHTAYPEFDNCGFNLNATCNDKMELYADDELLAKSNSWKETTVVHIPPNTKVVQINCVDGWILGGILASSDNGLMTNGAWNCSSDHEATWHPAHELWSNEMTLPEISPAAKWIWTKRPSWTHTKIRPHTTAICKIDLPSSHCPEEICPPFTKPISTQPPTSTTPPPPPSTPKPGFNMSATCDDKMKLLADGNLLATSNNWRYSSQVMIPANTKTLEIHCNNSGIVGGILASSDIGLLTDGAWNCSSDNGTTWSPAYEVGPNGKAVPDISPQAEWIWTGCIGDWTSKYTGQKHRNNVICKIDLDTTSTTATTTTATKTTTPTGCLYTDKYEDCPKFKDECKTEKFVDCMNRNCAKTCKCNNRLPTTPTTTTTTTTTASTTTTESIYFIAGGVGALRDIELYDPTMDDLSCSISPPPLNNDWTYHTTFYYNNIIYLYGGNSGTASTCISYNPGAKEWKTHTLTTSRYGHTTTILNKRLYIIGGRDSSNNFVTAESSPLPLTDQPVLTPVLNLDFKGQYQCTTKVDEDTLVITGGYYNGHLSYVIKYNAKTRTTTSLPSLKQPRYVHGCAVVEMDNTKWVIVAGGYNTADKYLKTTEMLEIGGSSWTSSEDLNVARYGHSLVVTQRGVMAMGGSSRSGILSSVELLDWSAKSWRIVEPSLSKSRRYFGGPVEIPASMFECRGRQQQQRNFLRKLPELEGPNLSRLPKQPSILNLPEQLEQNLAEQSGQGS